MLNMSVCEADIMCNHIVYKFNDGFVRHVYMKRLVRQAGYEEIDNYAEIDDKYQDVHKIDLEDDIEDFTKKGIIDPDNVERAVRRAKKAVRNMSILNRWNWFITWTVDPKKIDSSDSDKMYKYILNFLKRLRKHNSNLKYIVIPEYHKDGKKIHFHGFLYDPDNKLRMFDTGLKNKNGLKIFNMLNWDCGFSTAVCIGDTLEDQMKCSNYVSKYITKGCERIFPRFYLCSKGLINKPETHYLNDNWDKDELVKKGAYENDYCFIVDVYNKDFRMS